MKNKNSLTSSFNLGLLGILLVTLIGSSARAANVTLVGNGASSGPIIVASDGTDIALGTRLRVGRFSDTGLLNSTVSDFLSGTKNYNDTLLALGGNFVDIGTNVANFGSASQTGTGVSSSQYVFNNSFNLTVNGVTASRVGFFGSIANVNYGAATGIGNNSPLWVWTAFNNAIGIVRGPAWTTPASDLTALTLNLNTINLSNASSTVVLGTYTDYATGTDTIALAVPEPTSGALMMIGAVGLVALRRLRKV